MKLDPNSELGENLVATAASAGEAEGGYGRVLRYPQFASVCHLRPVMSLRLYLYGCCSVTRPAYNPLSGAILILFHCACCILSVNVSTVSQIKQTVNCHVFRCQQLTSVTIVLF